MKLVDSNKQQLDMMALLYQYFKNEYSEKTDADFQQWIVQTTALLADEKMTVEQIGNSLIVARRSAEDAPVAMLWVMNVDTIHNAPKNLAEGVMHLAQDGVVDFIGVYSKKIVSRMLKQAFKQIRNDEDTLRITTSKLGKIVAHLHLDQEAENV